jgi:hypothetical protein
MWAHLGIAEGEPGLAIYDANGTPRAIVSVPPEGPRLLLSDAGGKLRAEVVVDPGGPRLSLSDADGKLRAEVVVDGDGPALRIYQSDGEIAVALSWREGVSCVGLNGPGGNGGGLLQAAGEYVGLLLEDAKSVRRIDLAIKEQNAELELLNARGKLVYSVPPKRVQ